MDSKGFLQIRHLRESSPRNSQDQHENNPDSMKIEKLITWITAAIAFILPWVFTPFTYEYYEITKNTLLIFGVIALMVLWSIKATKEKKLSLIQTPFDLPILLFIGSQILAAIFSINSQTSIWGYYSRFTGGLISTLALGGLYFVIVNNVRTKQHVQKIVDALSLSISLLGLFVVLNSLGLLDGILNSIASDKVSLSFLNSSLFSPIGNPNALPLIFLGVLPLSLYILISKDKSPFQMFLGIISSSILTASIGILAISLGGIVSIIIFATMLIIFISFLFFNSPIELNLRYNIFPALLIFIFLIIFNFVPSIKNDLKSKTQFANYPQVPFKTDWAVTKGTLSEYNLRGYAVGTGPDTYVYNFSRFRPIEQNLQPNWHENFTHSSKHIFNLITDSGLIGLLTFVFLGYTVIFFITTKVMKKGNDKALIISLGLILIVSIIGSFITFLTITNLMIIWLSLALLISYFYIENQREQTILDISLLISKTQIAIENQKEVLPYVFITLTSIILLTCTYFVSRNFAAEYYYKKSLVALDAKDLNTSNDSIVKAIKINKNRDAYHRQLAFIALESLKKVTASNTTNDQEKQAKATQQNYLVSLIKDQLNETVKLNSVDSVNWKSSSIIYKQLIELTEGKLYGDETLYATAQAIRLDPYNPDNYIILGYIYQYNNNKDLRDKAQQVFEQAYKLQPTYPLSVLALGSYYEYVEKYDESIKLYNDSLIVYKNSRDLTQIIQNRISEVEKKKTNSTTKNEIDDVTDQLDDDLTSPSKNGNAK